MAATTLTIPKYGMVGVGVHTDITARKESEEALRQSEEDLRAVIEGLADGAVVVVEDEIVFCNAMLTEISGYPREEILGKSPLDFVHSDDRARAAEGIGEVLAGEPTGVGNYLMVRANGEVAPTEVSSALIMFEGKQAIASVIRDVSERKKAEEQLLKSEAHLQESQRIAHVGSWEFDIETGHGVWSEENYRLFGLAKDFQPSYEGFLKLVHPDDQEAVMNDTSGALKAGRLLINDHRIVRSDGDVRFHHAEAVVEADALGNPVRVVGISQDITERKTEERLRGAHEQLRALTAHLQTVREEERRAIAVEVHDDMAQVMVALRLDIEWLRGASASGEDLTDRLDAMVSLMDGAIDVGSRLITRLRPGVLDDLGITAAIDWLAEDFEKRTGIECLVTNDRREAVVGSDIATCMYHVLQEALTNVMRHAGASRVRIRIDPSRDHQVVMEVEDDGVGATDEDLSRSTALGVLGMKERTAALGGTVEISGASNQGTNVRVTLPRSVETAS